MDCSTTLSALDKALSEVLVVGPSSSSALSSLPQLSVADTVELLQLRAPLGVLSPFLVEQV